MKLYPVGIQTFERIRKEDKLYVDKTEYIYRMTHSGGCYFFLSRPRRFGKSLLASTFQSYFEGKKDLFKGLAIEKLEQEWTEYPVLHFDMSGGKHMEKKELEEYLGYQLAKKEATYGIATPQNGANNRLTDLILTAYQKYFLKASLFSKYQRTHKNRLKMHRRQFQQTGKKSLKNAYFLYSIQFAALEFYCTLKKQLLSFEYISHHTPLL